MDDDRVWTFETSLWTADAQHYKESIDHECLMVLPTPPFVFGGEDSVKAVSATPRWTKVALSHKRISRPVEGLIVVAYHVEAKRGEENYTAYCTSTYRRRGHEDWQVVQHQQTPPLVSSNEKG